MFITPIAPMEKMDFAKTDAAQGAASASFGSILDNAVKQYESASKTATEDGYQLALGSVNDLAKVQIDSMKAETMLQTTVQLTTRMVNAYKEVMQMQV